uniref:Uncharacterized protein n=1 Tax=Sphingobacterium sp. (strain 21) TaxID=743722 RepID=F4C9T8_SPHS2
MLWVNGLFVLLIFVLNIMAVYYPHLVVHPHYQGKGVGGYL